MNRAKPTTTAQLSRQMALGTLKTKLRGRDWWAYPTRAAV
jgi:hypothetical protein